MEHVEDVHFAQALARGDAMAMVRFERTSLSRVPSYLRRFRLGSAQVDDIMQQLRVKLFTGDDRKIDSYAGRGSFDAWLRVIATRLALTELRKKQEHAPPLSNVAVATAAAPDVLAMKNEVRGAFSTAVDQAFASLADDDRALLRMYFAEGLSTASIAAILAVHKATAARRLVQLRSDLRDEVRRRLGSLAASRDFESLLRLVLSQL